MNFTYRLDYTNDYNKKAQLTIEPVKNNNKALRNNESDKRAV